MKNEYVIRDDVTTIIIRRKNGSILETLIDTKDLPRADEFPGSWCVRWDKNTRSYYVFGSIKNSQGKWSSVQLHRWILNINSSDKVVDHINHNTLDNRRNNLRILTDAENKQNRKGAQKNNLSGIRGVHWSKHAKKWQARARLNKKDYFLGLFDTKEEAAKVISKWRKKYMPYSSG